MKELSIEEKAKRYDDILVKLQEAKTDDNVCDDRYCCVIDIIVPELKESEDERIRKGLLYVIEHHPTLPTEEAEEYIAWIEKQGEHKKFRDSIQIGDKVTRNEDGVLVNLSQLSRVAKKDEKQGEQKPAWSEEDEIGLWDALWAIQQARTIAKDENDMGNIWYAENWLKSLKDRVQPQNRWKPDKAVIQILELIIQGKANPTNYQATLMNLVEQLKKLREK